VNLAIMDTVLSMVNAQEQVLIMDAFNGMEINVLNAQEDGT